MQPRITAALDGRKVDLLYDTGVTSSCLTNKTISNLFTNKKPTMDSGVTAQGARKVSLGVIGEAFYDYVVKEKKLRHEILICNKIIDDIMGINLANN